MLRLSARVNYHCLAGGRLAERSGRERISEVFLSPDAFAHRTSEASIAEQLGDVLVANGLPRPAPADAARYGLVSGGRIAGVGPAFVPSRAGQAPPFHSQSNTPHFVTGMPLGEQIARQVTATDQTSRAIHFQRLEAEAKKAFRPTNCPDGQGSKFAAESAFAAQTERRRCYGKSRRDDLVETPLWEQQSFPEKLFRLSVLLCIVGWGLSAIYFASHVGPAEVPSVRARDLASYFFSASWIFVFFYAQYRVVPRFIHRDLDRRVGLWHAGGSLALLMVGALHVLLPQTKADVPSSLLFWITLLGEGVFIGNVVWSYARGEQAMPFLPVVPDAKATPAHVPDDSAKNMGWPKSPVKLFGIGAAVFAAGGLISLILDMPSFKFPVPWSGELHFVPFGFLWLAAAAPFAIFAMLYKFLMDAYDLAFKESLNRIHFVVTIITVLDLVRVFSAWEQWMGTKFATFFYGAEFQWLAVLFVLSAVVFAINAFRSYRRTAIRT